MATIKILPFRPIRLTVMERMGTSTNEQQQPKTNTIYRVAAYVLRYRGLFALTLSLAVGSTLCLIAIPWIISFVIDDVIPRQEPAALMWGVLVVVLCYLGRDVFNFARIRINNTLEQKVLLDLRHDVHNKLLDLPISYYDNRPSGEIASRVIEDVQNVERAILDGTEQGLIAVLTIFGVATILLFRQPGLALLVMIPLPVLILFGYNHARMTRRNWKLVRESAGSLNSLLVEHLQGNRLINAFALHRRERRRFGGRARKLRDTTLRAMYRYSLYISCSNFIGSMGAVMVLGFGGYLLMEGRMTHGELVGFFLYCAMFYEPINRLNQVNQLISAGKASGDRVFEILDHPVAVKNDPNPITFPEGLVEAEFRNVSFAYQERAPVVEGINLTLHAGKVTALVGHTGAGKSTLANLLLRYYDVTGGELLLNGADVRRIELEQLRSHIGYVAQEPFLFEGTVMDNLVLAREDATEEEMWEALSAAHADAFVDRLPDGIHTQIGERGIRLSQGEKQRLTIARVLLKNPAIVVLDEATSSVDTLTENRIQAALNRLMKDRTVLVIAHRLSTVQQADQIVVLQHGEIIEKGSHRDLITLGGQYAKMWRIQQDIIPETVT